MSLPHDHMHDPEPAVAHETSSIREPFGASQIFCLLAGIFFVVIGAVGLARAGFDSITEPVAEIGGMGMTPLLSLIHLGIGLAALVGATTRSGSRGACMFIGPLLVAGGIIALLQEIDALGYTETNGVVYLVVGIIAIVTAMLTPVVSVADRRVTSI